MMLRVVYTDGTFDLVKGLMLTTLIESSGVSKFKRSSGWVDINSAYVRKSGSESDYCGPERRGL
jgi:hypothetical protein